MLLMFYSILTELLQGFLFKFCEHFTLLKNNFKTTHPVRFCRRALFVLLVDYMATYKHSRTILV